MTSEIIRAAIRQSTGRDGKVAVTQLVVNLSGVQRGSIYKVCLAFDKFRGISAAPRRGVTRNLEPEDAVVYASEFIIWFANRRAKRTSTGGSYQRNDCVEDTLSPRPESEVSVEALDVESGFQSQKSSGPKPQIFAEAEVIQDKNSVGLEGADHLYCASRVDEPILKIGITKDILERLKTLASRWDSNYQLLAIWPHEAALEELVHAQLKPRRAPVGNSREHFHASLQEVHEAVQAARNLYRISSDLKKISREEREFEEDLADRAAKRQKMILETTAEALKTIAEAEKERLLIRLASEGNESALNAFLRQMANS